MNLPKPILTLFLLFIALLWQLCFVASTYAQEIRQVSGVLLDSTGWKISGAQVTLSGAKDTLYAHSNDSGVFRFNRVKLTEFELNIHHLGYEPYQRKFTVKKREEDIDLGKLQLDIRPVNLDDVVIEGGSRVRFLGDTIEFRTRDIPLEAHARLEELMRRLPGMHADLEGNLWFNGEKISKVRINGIDFFGGDVVGALKNLPADMLNKLQIIDDYGEGAKLSGRREGEPEKVLNLVVDEDKNKGSYTSNTLGGGTGKTYQISLEGKTFNKERQFGLSGGRNNINKATATSSGIAVVTPSDPGTFSRGGAGVNVSTGGRVHYSDAWGDDLKGLVNYSIDHTDRQTESSTFSQRAFAQSRAQIEDVSSSGHSELLSHNLITRLDYQPDENTSAFLFPTVSIRQGNTRNENREDMQMLGNGVQESRQTSQNTSSAQDDNTSGGASLMINRKLNKKGRNLQLSADFHLRDRDKDEFRESNMLLYDSEDTMTNDSLQSIHVNEMNRSNNIRVALSYNEPLSEKLFLDVGVSHRRSEENRERAVWDLADEGQFVDSLSTYYNYNYRENKGRVSLRYQTEKASISINMNGVQSLMRGRYRSDAIANTRNAFHLSPTALAYWTVSDKGRLSFQYNWRIVEPAFAQLFPVTDHTHPQRVVIGNPNLRAESLQAGGISYTSFSPKTNIMGNVSLDFMSYKDRVVENVALREDEKGFMVQRVGYENVSGDYTLRFYYNYSLPLIKKKPNHLKLLIMGQMTFNRQAFLEESVQYDQQQLSFRPGIGLNSAMENGLVFMSNILYHYNKYLGSQMPSSFQSAPLTSLRFSTSAKIPFLQNYDVVLQFSQQFNKGYGGGTNASPTVLSGSIGRKFFKDKSGELKINVHDAFNQSVRLNRRVQANSIVDRQDNSLGRYIFLSYSQRLGKFF